MRTIFAGGLAHLWSSQCKLLLGGFSLATALLVACPGSPVSAEKLGLDFWHAGEWMRQIESSEIRMREMDRKSDLALARTKSREQILKNHMEGKITLEQTAEGFHTLNLEEPSVLNYLRLIHPEGTDLDRAVIQIKLHLRSFALMNSQELAARQTDEPAAVRVFRRGEQWRGSHISRCNRLGY